jgi:proteic killer suppression protein
LRLDAIHSIRHKGLKRLYEGDDPRGVIAEHVVKLRDILARLDAARTVADMDIPGLRLHQLEGEFKGLWAVVPTGESSFVLPTPMLSM